MKLTFIGATHEVTGSCYFLEAAGKRFLVDCGMEPVSYTHLSRNNGDSASTSKKASFKLLFFSINKLLEFVGSTTE